jgi:hypothetical protein
LTYENQRLFIANLALAAFSTLSSQFSTVDAATQRFYRVQAVRPLTP